MGTERDARATREPALERAKIGRTLLVLAQPALRVTAHESLGRLGLALHEVEDTEAAVALVEERPPDLVLVDAALPSDLGFSLCKRLRDHPAMRATPILMVVPPDDGKALSRAFENGASDVIRKPVHWLLLSNRVESLLRLRASELASSESRSQLQRLRRLARVATWEFHPGTKRLHVSAEVPGLFGLEAGPDVLPLDTLLAPVRADSRRVLRNALEKCASDGADFGLQTNVLLPDHKQRVLWWHAEAASDARGRIIRIGGILQDVTEQRQAEKQIRYLAHHDGLTGLLNRYAFIEQLNRSLHLAKRHGRSLALLFLDLDGFKRINDTLGHLAGDAILGDFARRLEHCVRQTDVVGRQFAQNRISRLGGDEFTILLADISEGDDAARVARRIIDAMREPFVIQRRETLIGTSIGISVFPSDGEDVAMLLKKADRAMYAAKEQGRNQYRFFTESLHESAARRFTLEQRLGQAFEKGELRLFYQPQVDIRTLRITGVEALLRWDDPELGAVSPSEFVPVAEESGLIGAIGAWVLETACRQARAWRDLGLVPLKVAVNVSPRQFRDRTLAEIVTRVLWETELEASNVELEITEGAFMRNLDAAVSIASDLKRIGVSISLDDFGTGFSSLSYLRHFPIDTIKVDRSFIRDIVADPADASITAAMISMAKALDLRVVAEGVESEGQRKLLTSWGCDEIQGYVFSPPMAADALTEFLLTGTRR